MKELAERLGCVSHLIDSVEDIDPQWLVGKSQFGVTAGASAPEILVKKVIKELKSLSGRDPIELSGVEENIFFSLPKELRSELP